MTAHYYLLRCHNHLKSQQGFFNFLCGAEIGLEKMFSLLNVELLLGHMSQATVTCLACSNVMEMGTDYRQPTKQKRFRIF